MLSKTLVIFLSVLLLWPFTWQSPEFDLVITNGRIVDGTGNPGLKLTLLSKTERSQKSVASQRIARPKPLTPKA